MENRKIGKKEKEKSLTKNPQKRRGKFAAKPYSVPRKKLPLSRRDMVTHTGTAFDGFEFTIAEALRNPTPERDEKRTERDDCENGKLEKKRKRKV